MTDSVLPSQVGTQRNTFDIERERLCEQLFPLYLQVVQVGFGHPFEQHVRDVRGDDIPIEIEEYELVEDRNGLDVRDLCEANHAKHQDSVPVPWPWLRRSYPSVPHGFSSLPQKGALRPASSESSTGQSWPL